MSENRSRTYLIGLTIICCVSSICAKTQSPYALIGADRQALGPIGWTEGANLSEKMHYVMEAWAMDDGFSGAVLIAKGGEVVYKEAFGMANQSYDIANTINTKFMVGYLSFHLTHYLIAKWVVEGKIELDSPVVKYLPQLKAEHFNVITIDNLLNYHSGLNESLEGLVNLNEPNSLSFLTELIDAQPLVSKPGSSYSFGWSSPVILAKIIEELGSVSFEEAISDEIITSLGLKNTGFLSVPEVVSDLATPYVDVFGKKVPYQMSDPMALGPQATLYSTVEDLYVIYQHIFNFLNSNGLKAKKAMHIRFFGIENGKLSSQDGLLGEETEGDGDKFELMDMNGWYNGYTPLISALTDQNTMIIVLSNTFRATEIYDIRRRFFRSIYDLPLGMPLPKTKSSIWKKLEEDGFEAAADYYKDLTAKGIASVPLRDEFMFLSREMRRQKRFKEALEVSKMFVAIDSGWVAHRELGEVYRLMKRPALAKKSYKKSLGLKPDNANWKKQMEAYIKNNQY